MTPKWKDCESWNTVVTLSWTDYWWKKGEKLDPDNYRPISLLSNISKLSEKAMHIQLANFLRKNKVLFSYQLGFWNNYSTNHPLISLTEMIRNAFDNDSCACGVFIDLQKAFDTVNYDISFFPN